MNHEQEARWFLGKFNLAGLCCQGFWFDRAALILMRFLLGNCYPRGDSQHDSGGNDVEDAMSWKGNDENVLAVKCLADAMLPDLTIGLIDHFWSLLVREEETFRAEKLSVKSKQSTIWSNCCRSRKYLRYKLSHWGIWEGFNSTKKLETNRRGAGWRRLVALISFNSDIRRIVTITLWQINDCMLN